LTAAFLLSIHILSSWHILYFPFDEELYAIKSRFVAPCGKIYPDFPKLFPVCSSAYARFYSPVHESAMSGDTRKNSLWKLAAWLALLRKAYKAAL
jgi:hypothetical protein